MPKELIIRFVDILTELLIWIILIRVILSWFRPKPGNPLVQIINSVSEPFLAFGRKILPPTRMGIDFSPILVFLGLSLLRNVLINLLTTWIP